MVAGLVVIFRVGARALRVGQIVGALTLAAVACAPAPAPRSTPDLVIPRLDGDAGPPPATGAGARFGHPPATVGAAWTVELRAASRSPDPPGGARGEQITLYESTYRVEVLAVAGPAPSRVKLGIVRNVHTLQDRPTPTVIDGKEYVVDARPPHVRDAAGAAASPAESERVLDIFPDLGTRARVDQVLPDETLAVGARHDDLAAAILRVIHPRLWTLRAGTATLARLDGEHAVFAIDLTATSDSGLRLQISGEARVRLRDARLEGLVLDGRYERPGAEATDPPGTFELRRTVTSEPEARSGR